MTTFQPSPALAAAQMMYMPMFAPSSVASSREQMTVTPPLAMSIASSPTAQPALPQTVQQQLWLENMTKILMMNQSLNNPSFQNTSAVFNAANHLAAQAHVGAFPLPFSNPLPFSMARAKKSRSKSGDKLKRLQAGHSPQGLVLSSGRPSSRRAAGSPVGSSKPVKRKQTKKPKAKAEKAYGGLGKPPKNAFMVFSARKRADVAEQMQREMSTLTRDRLVDNREVSKRLGRIWRAMPDSEKATYIEELRTWKLKVAELQEAQSPISEQSPSPEHAGPLLA